MYLWNTGWNTIYNLHRSVLLYNFRKKTTRAVVTILSKLTPQENINKLKKDTQDIYVFKTGWVDRSGGFV